MLQQRMAKFCAQPEGTGQIFRAAALLVAHLHEQTSLLAPYCAKNLPPSRPRLKREQTHQYGHFLPSLIDGRGTFNRVLFF
ncbi:hypothetical protein AXE65_09955 [Ventosimonas gracilis]|uniref:Uncharacterized protein n=1 Tax=Ventosimonas gracilis TaxID=1680762 RepID=A0A139SXP3_9GAMM|nr:hypothetical protein AXE65_09955 [Ventosimonas gracilis]